MKNTTLLKVLSATAIFSAIAAIEAYDQDSFAYAAETTVVTSNPATATTSTDEAEKAEREKLEAEKAEREKLEAEKAEREKLEAEKAEREKAEAEKAEREKAEAEKAEREKATTSVTPTAPATAPTAPATSTTAPATSVTTPAATTSTTPAHNAEEPATVPQDVKALKDGEYKITAEALKFYEEGSPSMAAAAIDNDKTKLIVKNGQYSVNVSFKPITFGGLTGYLGDLKYYDGDKTHENRKEIQNNEFKDSTIVENYSANETDNFVDAYKKQFPNRTVYPKTVNYNVDKNKIDSNNKLETYTEVFVPVMASINPAFGTQKMTLKFDLTSLSRKKVTADNYQAATYDNPNKDVEYKGEIKKPFPIHVQGHFRNANNNEEESLYGSALDSYVKIEKVGDKYKYTLRFKKGLADVGGEFYPFELHKVAYQGKDIPLTTLATNGNSSVKEGSIITDKLLEKIQLDGTAPYPNGALMSHFVTLQLYYITATPYTERPAKIEDVVAPSKPKPATPAPTPVKPKEDPTPASPTASDHVADADRVPNTFPAIVKAELNGRTTGTASIYEDSFVKDVKVEKVGDKYQYTIRVKEGKSTSNFLLRNKPFTVSKLTYKGTEINFTEVDAATKLKEGKILTDSLLDKIQVDAVMSVQTKGGAKPRYEERAAESTITVDFPKVEKTKEIVPAKPTVPDHEVEANKVPATFPTTVKAELNGRTTNSSSIYEDSFVKDVKVEKVGDKYQYTIRVKEGKSTSNFLLRNKPFTISKLTYKGTEINFTEVDAATKLKEGTILTDSLLDKIQVDAVMSVQTKGGAKPRYEERAAESTIALDFPTVEATKKEAANNSVPAKIYDASVANKLSMADGALVHEKTRVEKVNDTYHYYLTFKNLQFGALVGTVDSISVDGKTAERTDLGGEGNEKLFHFTSAEKLTEKTINFAVLANGEPLKGHSNVPATLNFNWNAATPLTADQVTAAHQEETTKAQAEAAAKAEKEKAAEAAKAQAEKERLEKEAAEAAAKAQAEKERLEREKAAEAAAKAQAEKERLEKERLEREKALKEAVEKIEAENNKVEDQAKAAKETITNLETSKAQLEKLVKEKEAAINNATTEAEKEKLATEKVAAEKELTAKVTELKAENEKVVKLENKVNEIKQLEEVKTEAVGKIQAENKETEKEAEAAKETVTKLETAKAQLEKLVKEKEEAINNATTEAEKEKLVTEKAIVEKELTAKVTELKTEAEKAVKLENKVNEIKQIEAIVKTASLKDTLVAKVEGTAEEIKVSFDNKDVQASNLVVKKADTETVAKVEELAKKADENLNVVKTIDLYFTDANGDKINKQGETRTVTVAVVANEGEQLEVYYVNEDKVNGDKLEKVPSVYKDGKLTFFTSHFSKYTILSKTIASNQNTPVPVTPSTDSTKPVVTDKTEALTQPELPALNINELSKEQNVKEESEATAQNIFGQVNNKENKNVEVEKTVAQNTPQTVATGLKQLAKTGLNVTATAGLGVLALLSALVLRRKNNK